MISSSTPTIGIGLNRNTKSPDTVAEINHLDPGFRRDDRVSQATPSVSVQSSDGDLPTALLRDVDRVGVDPDEVRVGKVDEAAQAGAQVLGPHAYLRPVGARLIDHHRQVAVAAADLDPAIL